MLLAAFGWFRRTHSYTHPKTSRNAVLASVFRSEKNSDGFHIHFNTHAIVTDMVNQLAPRGCDGVACVRVCVVEHAFLWCVSGLTFVDAPISQVPP